MSDDSTLVAYYDLKSAPITFDFTNFIIAATAFATLNREPYLDLVIVADGFRNLTPREKTYTMVDRNWRLWNLLVEIAKVIPQIRTITVQRHPLTRVAQKCFPPQYKPPDEIRVPYNVQTVMNLFQMGVDVRFLRPSEYALSSAEQLLSKNKEKVVSITLRKSGFDTVRNSRVEDWFEFSKILKQRGFDCVIIPDQEDALSTRTLNQFDWKVLDVAAMSVDLRLAIYTQSHINYVTNGGMMPLFMYSIVPFKMFSVTVEGSKVASIDYYRAQGIEAGSKYPWLKEHQNMYWQADTLENLLASLD
jgi:hypothetical protein